MSYKTKIGTVSRKVPPAYTDTPRANAAHRAADQKMYEEMYGRFDHRSGMTILDPNVVRAGMMYPSRIPIGKTTMANDHREVWEGERQLHGRRIDGEGSDRGGGKIRGSGFTHGKKQVGVKRLGKGRGRGR
jgi:hypothetical protein